MLNQHPTSEKLAILFWYPMSNPTSHDQPLPLPVRSGSVKVDPSPSPAGSDAARASAKSSSGLWLSLRPGRIRIFSIAAFSGPSHQLRPMWHRHGHRPKGPDHVPPGCWEQCACILFELPARGRSEFSYSNLLPQSLHVHVRCWPAGGDVGSGRSNGVTSYQGVGMLLRSTGVQVGSYLQLDELLHSWNAGGMPL